MGHKWLCNALFHESHAETEKTCNLAKEIMFWPGLHSAIQDYISKCEICNEHNSSNQKEPMILSTISESPWHVLRNDLFTWNRNNYVLVVDYMSMLSKLRKRNLPLLSVI